MQGQSPLALYAKQAVRHHRRKIQEESDGLSGKPLPA